MLKNMNLKEKSMNNSQQTNVLNQKGFITNFFSRLRSKLKKDLKLTCFAMLMSVANFLFFHYRCFAFVAENVDWHSFNSIIIIASLVVIMLAANFLVFYLVLFLFRFVGRLLLALTFAVNAVAVYFINTYNVILDESMISNVFNTNYDEASSFWSFKLALYFILFAVVPGIYIFKVKIINGTWKRFFTTTSLTIVFLLILVFANAGNWLWIDKHATKLGGLLMPWSYTVNAVRYQTHQRQQNKKEILLPDAAISDNEKAVVVLVIGESARSQNFSLLGYEKNTNPLLSGTQNVFAFKAESDATYTTASVKCILEHKSTSDLYEILPNYLYRNGVDVAWRSSNWGEPPVHIKDYQKKAQLTAECKGEECDYDGILFSGLTERILASEKNKILIVLHTSTSHGPQYSKRYPPKFEVFKPVCNSVELANCSHEELINAYDNTIVYTDYLLHSVIEDLSNLKEYKSAMIFVSDHGESLGEKNLYMHGVPKSIAPKEQYEIPFIVWLSEGSKQLKPGINVSQHNIFHSVMNFLGVESPIYDEEMNIFQ
ncbi:phosphoethanolamine transferase EptA [Bacteroidia bacterium]|nr:phosphoethanolamine transferase EptA [Bacteroidia bacterium]